MQKYSYFDFLLDKTGQVLKNYLENEEKDPPPWSLCKQFIEKSLAVASTAAAAQANTETTLKVYEAQRIWQPLCLAMTVISHLKWDLDAIQKNIPLHLQQILMEELLKGYGIPMVPKPEDFDINKFGKRGAMVHIIYNRWVVRTITKYEVLKEKDALLTGLSSVMKETKEQQEQQIFTKVKEYRNLSLDILEKSLFLESDTEIPFPMPRLVTDKEIIPQIDESLILKKPEGDIKKEADSDEVSLKDNEEEKVKKEDTEKEPVKGTIMKIPPLLDETITMPAAECISKICYDLGCYYFPKELYSDAWRVFHKAFESAVEEDKKLDWYATMIGYYEACCLMLNKPRPESIKRDDLCYRFEESLRINFKDINEILVADNFEKKIPFTQRQHLEDEFYRLDKRDSLFAICALNFIRSCFEGRIVSFAFYDCLKYASKDELAQFFKYCNDALDKVTSEECEERLQYGVRLAIQYLGEDQKVSIKDSEHFKRFSEKNMEENTAKRQRTDREGAQSPSFDESLSNISLSHVDSSKGYIFPGIESDERISPIIRLKARLTSCFNPEKIKDILYELHETNPDQSHCMGYECDMYQEIFSEIEDLLMFDTIHVCITKSKQLSLQGNYTEALSILNVCLDTLNKYGKRATACPVGRVKNILHHELLWIELKFAETSPDRANEKETMRRSKACIEYVRQDPPPKPHIYQAIVIYLLNNKEYKFLIDAVDNYDVQVVDFLQLGFHFSAVMSAGKQHTDGNQSKALWEAVLKIIGDIDEHETVQPTANLARARGPAEEIQMWNLKCYITKEEFISILTSLKDDTLLSIMLSCLSSMLCVAKGDTTVEIKDTLLDMWPKSFDVNVAITSAQILSVQIPLCEYCLEKNPQKLAWLRQIADVFLVEGDYARAMKHYLEIGSVSTSFFSRPVPHSIYDDKIYRNMISCCQAQEAHTQVIILCQFTDPVDYPTAFEAIHKKSSDDGMDTFYDCLWDVNIFEYLIYAHNKKGEIEKRKLAVKTLGQPELNCRGSPEISKQSQDIRKTKFLRTLMKQYWS